MIGLMLLSLACVQEPLKECPEPLEREREIQLLNDEIDSLSSRIRGLQRFNERLQDQLDLYKADIQDSSSIAAHFHTTNGKISCMLFVEQAPKAVSNFVSLAEGRIRWKHPTTQEEHQYPFYDGTIFHRVIANQLIQGGDPSGLGTGGPGYTFPDEQNSFRFNEEGRLAMANTGPNSNGSQFFITTVDCPWLDGKHVVFGKATGGLDVIDKMEAVGSGSGATSQPVVIEDCGEL